MRSGKGSARKYRTRSRGRGLLLLMAGALLGAGALAFSRGWSLLPQRAESIAPIALSSPEDREEAEVTLTLPGLSWYALQTGSFQSLDEALAQGEAFRKRGAGGYVFRKNQYLVLAAAYDTRSDAQAVGNRLLTQRQVEMKTVEITRPQVVIKMSGQKALLTAIQDAYSAVDQMAYRLFSLSQEIDTGAANQESARAALLSERDTALALAKRLKELSQGNVHKAVGDLILILEDVSAGLDQGLTAQSLTALGGQIKYCQLLCVCQMAAYQENLR